MSFNPGYRTSLWHSFVVMVLLPQILLLYKVLQPKRLPAKKEVSYFKLRMLCLKLHMRSNFLALLHLLLEEPVCTTESIERIGKEERKSPAPNGIRTHDLDQWSVRPSWIVQNLAQMSPVTRSRLEWLWAFMKYLNFSQLWTIWSRCPTVEWLRSGYASSSSLKVLQ